MQVTDILVAEHEIIINRINQLKVDLEIPLVEKIEKIKKHIEFIRVYADEYHHAKEEAIYFEWMKSKNPYLEQGPLRCMLSEHQEGRDYVNLAMESINKYQLKKDSEELVQMKNNLMNFCHLLENHIQKENEVLYVMAESLNDQSTDGDEVMLSTFLKINEHLSEKVKSFL